MLALAKVEQLRQQGDAPVAGLGRDRARGGARPGAADRRSGGSTSRSTPCRRRCARHDWALRELTRNLLHNAIKHSPRQRPLAVRLARDGRAGGADHRRQRPGHRRRAAAAAVPALRQPATRAAARAWAWRSAARSSPAWAADRAGQPRPAGPRGRAGRDGEAGGRRQSLRDTATENRWTTTGCGWTKWLWAARFYKTRSLAVEFIEKGRVPYRTTASRPSGLAAQPQLASPLGRLAV